MGTPEKEMLSYSSIEDLFSKLAGADTLVDLKKFFSRNHILKVLEVLSNGQNINQMAKRELDYIYIHPDTKDHKLFFGDHFSLNNEILEEIVKIGYKRAMNILKNYKFKWLMFFHA